MIKNFFSYCTLLIALFFVYVGSASALEVLSLPAPLPANQCDVNVNLDLYGPDNYQLYDQYNQTAQ